MRRHKIKRMKKELAHLETIMAPRRVRQEKEMGNKGMAKLPKMMA